jgi:hypothetical protein
MNIDIYGLLKHYRDELSWYDEENKRQYVVLGTKDVQVILERYWREQIAKEIEALADGIKPKNKFIAKYAPVDAKEIVWRAARIARGKRD